MIRLFAAALAFLLAFLSPATAQRPKGGAFLGRGESSIGGFASNGARSNPSGAPGAPSAPVTTTAPGDPVRVPTILISTHACTQRAETGAPAGVSTSLRDAIGDCIRDLPAYRAPERNRRRGPDIGALAWSAIDEVRRIAPAPRLRIAPNRRGITGLQSYFWLAQRPAPVRAVAEVPGITVVAEARPDHYLWRFGEGDDRLTHHPGRPWTRARPGNVEHLYETKGHYDVSVEVVWAARWRIGDGPWRALGFFSTVDSRPYPVAEVVPVLTDAG